jgi:hypothetical protein
MIILAMDGYRYLVKLNKSDDRCYCIDTKLNFVYGYDFPEKFMRFGNYIEYDMDKLSDTLRKRIEKTLKNNYYTN